MFLYRMLGYPYCYLLGVGTCGEGCSQSLRMNITKYNEWTAAVVRIIRAAGGKNAQRILILGALQKNLQEPGHDRQKDLQK